MWYFVWLLGMPAAVIFAIVSAVLYELKQSDRDYSMKS